MTLKSLTANYECDGCARPFTVYLDPADEINGASLHDAAENALSFELHVTKQRDLHLCETCTKIADQIPDPSDPDDEELADNYSPTRDEILAAIAEHNKTQPADVPRPSIYHTQSEAWQRGYDWHRNIGPNSELDFLAALESWGYKMLTKEHDDFDHGSRYAEMESLSS